MQKKAQILTDEELVKLSRVDPESFGMLIDRYHGRLGAFIRKLFYFEPEEIEDLLQESFIKAYRGLNGFDLSMKFSTWMYQITRNAAIDAIRKKDCRPKIANLEMSEIENFFGKEIELERELLAKEDLRMVKDVIDGLPLKYREVLVLKFLEEKNYEEIMDIVKKPKGTVAALISRGRREILKALASLK